MDRSAQYDVTNKNAKLEDLERQYETGKISAAEYETQRKATLKSKRKNMKK
jgi:hypothetical protein